MIWVLILIALCLFSFLKGGIFGAGCTLLLAYVGYKAFD